MNSDSVSPGSNPGSPAKHFLENQGFPFPDKSDKAEQSADTGRTKVGTVLLPVECGHCGWTGKRSPGKIVYCPYCGSPAAFQPLT